MSKISRPFLLLLALALAPVCLAQAASETGSQIPEDTKNKIADSALQETRELFARELFGHYDITTLTILKIEDLRGQLSLAHDYGLVKTTLAFSAKRNATKSPRFNRAMFEPGSAMCQGWLYLHCGVPEGHIFGGTLEVLLAFNGDGSWRLVSPRWRSLSEYSLHGYLVLGGREKEGYVLSPKK